MYCADGRTSPRWKDHKEHDFSTGNRCTECGVQTFPGERVSRRRVRVGNEHHVSGYALAQSVQSTPESLMSPAIQPTRQYTKPDREICKHGHRMTEENTTIRADGYRVCRTCRRAYTQGQMARLKERKAAA